MLHLVDCKPVIGGYAPKINNIFHVRCEIRNEKYILSPFSVILSKALIINVKKGQTCPSLSAGRAYRKNETMQPLKGLRKLKEKKIE